MARKRASAAGSPWLMSGWCCGRGKAGAGEPVRAQGGRPAGGWRASVRLGGQHAPRGVPFSSLFPPGLACCRPSGLERVRPTACCGALPCEWFDRYGEAWGLQRVAKAAGNGVGVLVRPASRPQPTGDQRALPTTTGLVLSRRPSPEPVGPFLDQLLQRESQVKNAQLRMDGGPSQELVLVLSQRLGPPSNRSWTF